MIQIDISSGRYECSSCGYENIRWLDARCGNCESPIAWFKVIPGSVGTVPATVVADGDVPFEAIFRAACGLPTSDDSVDEPILIGGGDRAMGHDTQDTA